MSDVLHIKKVQIFETTEKPNKVYENILKTLDIRQQSIVILKRLSPVTASAYRHESFLAVVQVMGTQQNLMASLSWKEKELLSGRLILLEFLGQGSRKMRPAKRESYRRSPWRIQLSICDHRSRKEPSERIIRNNSLKPAQSQEKCIFPPATVGSLIIHRVLDREFRSCT